MTGLVRNGDLPEFDQAASGTPAEFKAYLDRVSGYAEAKELGYGDGIRQTEVVAHASLEREALDSQDPRRLATVLDCGDVLDQVIASIRLLTIPKSELNKAPGMVGNPMGDEELEALMTRAQRALSLQLVAHPGLLHPRVFIKSSHFARSERGPIAHVIARSTRIEFPRVSHGIPVGMLRAFARHHAVRAAFTGAAPKPDTDRSEKTFQGKTMLQSVGQWLQAPRIKLVVSALELDEHRAFAVPAARRPASLLASQDSDVRDRLNKCFAASLLACFNLKTELGGDMSCDPSDLVRALKSTGTSDSDTFMTEVENLMWHWAKLEPKEVPAAIHGLAKALLQLQPRTWHGPHVSTDTSADNPVTEQMVVQWLTVATLDSSAERANAIESRFKSLPVVDVERKVALLAAIDSVAPRYWPDVQVLVERIFENRLDAEGPAWRSALTVHAMRRTIAAASASASTIQRHAATETARPAPQADLFESGEMDARVGDASLPSPVRRSRAV